MGAGTGASYRDADLRYEGPNAVAYQDTYQKQTNQEQNNWTDLIQMTNKLNNVLLPEIERRPPSSASGREIRINYITQIRTGPPLFAFFSNDPLKIKTEYKRFLENQLREHFGLEGVPVSLVFRKKNR